MNQFLKNHQLNNAEIGVTDESMSDWFSGLQDTFSSIEENLIFPYMLIYDRIGLVLLCMEILSQLNSK